jgi:hypothetical protein
VEKTNMAKKQIDLIRESICVQRKFVECRELFREGTIDFSVIEGFVDDRGRSCLFRLKTMSHALFRNSDTAGFKEKLYDMTVGYVFHEAMKLRENCYQLEYYRPQSNGGKNILSVEESKVVREIEYLLKRAGRRVGEGMAEVRILLRQLRIQLKDLILSYGDNYLLPRFILENEKALLGLYGKRGFEELLKGVFLDGRTMLLFRAAESYIESEFYDRARNLLQKVVRREETDRMAEFLYRYASAFHFYFKSRYRRAGAFAEEALAMDVEGPESAYRRNLVQLTEDTAKELRRRKVRRRQGGK